MFPPTIPLVEKTQSVSGLRVGALFFSLKQQSADQAAVSAALVHRGRGIGRGSADDCDVCDARVVLGN
jgi:hypothetical protein